MRRLLVAVLLLFAAPAFGQGAKKLSDVACKIDGSAGCGGGSSLSGLTTNGVVVATSGTAIGTPDSSVQLYSDVHSFGLPQQGSTIPGYGFYAAVGSSFNWTGLGGDSSNGFSLISFNTPMFYGVYNVGVGSWDNALFIGAPAFTTTTWLSTPTVNGQLLVGATKGVNDGQLDVRTYVSSSANSAQWIHGQTSELITLSTGGTTTDSSANLLPANSIIESVTARVTTTITTATNWKMGDATTAGRFTAANSTLVAGTTDVGLVHVDQTGAAGPRQTAAAKLRITTTGTPGAGVVRVTVFYRQFIPPAT